MSSRKLPAPYFAGFLRFLNSTFASIFYVHILSGYNLFFPIFRTEYCQVISSAFSQPLCSKIISDFSLFFTNFPRLIYIIKTILNNQPDQPKWSLWTPEWNTTQYEPKDMMEE